MSILNEETRRKLRELNLNEVIEAVDLQSLNIDYTHMSFDDRMKLIVDYVYQEKYNHKVKRLVKGSKFRVSNATVTDIYYPERGLDKNGLLNLSTGQYIDTNSSVIFQGFAGSGKTYLACALGKQACLQGIRTRYIRMPDLLMARGEATLTPLGISKLLKKFANYKLLILDEWLMNKFTDEEQHFVFELIERRYDTSSTIFCTQYRQGEWHERLGGGVHAESMIDRIVHNASWMESGNINMREFLSSKPKVL
jgi:DNA replication protein DnaC